MILKITLIKIDWDIWGQSKNYLYRSLVFTLATNICVNVGRNNHRALRRMKNLKYLLHCFRLKNHQEIKFNYSEIFLVQCAAFIAPYGVVGFVVG